MGECVLLLLGLVFPYQANGFSMIPSQDIGLGKERLRNDLFCVEWDVKP